VLKGKKEGRGKEVRKLAKGYNLGRGGENVHTERGEEPQVRGSRKENV